jgi:hypothetical protein
MRSLLVLILLIIGKASLLVSLEVSSYNAHEIGMKIWMNESKKSITGLCWWNQGENFASMGIGHFIWYPKGNKGLFEEQFPALLLYLKQNRVDLPTWLEHDLSCPWDNREDFFADQNSERMNELRDMLISSIDLQVEFMVQRLKQLLPKIIQATSLNGHDVILRNFKRLEADPQGFYPLLDYLNFKGEGTNSKERYNGQGWGLVQVLENMKDNHSALEDFAVSAKEILTLRVKNSPPDRNEQKWLPGWLNRVNTYVTKSI